MELKAREKKQTIRRQVLKMDAAELGEALYDGLKGKVSFTIDPRKTPTLSIVRTESVGYGRATHGRIVIKEGDVLQMEWKESGDGAKKKPEKDKK